MGNHHEITIWENMLYFFQASNMQIEGLVGLFVLQGIF